AWFIERHFKTKNIVSFKLGVIVWGDDRMFITAESDCMTHMVSPKRRETVFFYLLDCLSKECSSRNIRLCMVKQIELSGKNCIVSFLLESIRFTDDHSSCNV